MPPIISSPNQPDLPIIIRPLTREQTAAAAQLCVQRLDQAHVYDDRLPPTANGDYAAQALDLAWRRRLRDTQFIGLGAWLDDTLVGVLGASYRILPPNSPEIIWSPRASGWLPFALCAIAPGQPLPAILAALTQAADSWLDQYAIPLRFASALARDAAMLAVWRNLGYHPHATFALLDPPALPRLLSSPTPANTTIRPARPTDTPAITSLLIASHHLHARLPGSFYTAEDGDRYYPRIIHDEVTAATDMRQPDHPNSTPFYLVAEANARLIGVASAYVRDTGPSELARFTQPHPLGLIDEVSIAAEWRQRGVGAALVASLASELLIRGAHTLGLHYLTANPLASRAWPRLGFVPFELRLRAAPIISGPLSARPPDDRPNHVSPVAPDEEPRA